MAWQDRLQKASFRGVEFQVEADDAAFGRRIQLHEYPQRDKPYAEDLGRKAREISLTAFLLGPDYMEVRDQLLEAVEKPGPGTLVHPWYGELTVSIKDDGCRVTHARDEGGMCRVQLSFVESGELAFPSAADAAGAKVLMATDTMEAVSIEEFGQDFSLDNLPAWVTDDAIASATSILDELDAALSSGVLANPIGTLMDELGPLLSTPMGFAKRVFGLFSKASAILQTSAKFADFSSLNFLRAFSSIQAASRFKNAARPAGTITPARTRLYDNRDAISTLVRRAALMQAAGMTAAMPLPVYDDAVALRQDLLAALDEEAATASDTAYTALMDLRTQVHVDMTTRLRSAARLQEVRPRAVMPALALAYDLYEDTGREGEIIARNRIRHPGFIPAESLKVLSA